MTKWGTGGGGGDERAVQSHSTRKGHTDISIPGFVPCQPGLWSHLSFVFLDWEVWFCHWGQSLASQVPDGLILRGREKQGMNSDLCSCYYRFLNSYREYFPWFGVWGGQWFAQRFHLGHSFFSLLPFFFESLCLQGQVTASFLQSQAKTKI